MAAMKLRKSECAKENDHPLPMDSDQNTPSPLTVKDFAPEDQPRERAERYGVGVLPTTDLWAIVLRTGVPGTPITQLCRDLMRTAGGTMRGLEQTPREILMQSKGIGMTKAIQIEAVLELIRRYNLEQLPERPVIKSSQDTFNIMSPHIGNLDHEEIWVLFLNQRNEVIEKRRFTVGSATASIFDAKSILRRALLVKAQALIMTHNHPSGNLQPSPQDDMITRRLYEGAKYLDLRMLDHIIVAHSGFYSYHDQGRL